MHRYVSRRKKIVSRSCPDTRKQRIPKASIYKKKKEINENTNHKINESAPPWGGDTKF